MVVNRGGDGVDYYLALADQTLKEHSMLVNHRRERLSEAAAVPNGLGRPGTLPGCDGEQRSVTLQPSRIATAKGKALTCKLTELDGAALGIARCAFWCDRSPGELRVSGFDQPGRVVTRCLIGDVRRVLVQFSDGALVRARVSCVSFEPGAGRIVTLQIEGRTGNSIVDRVMDDAPCSIRSQQRGGDA